MSELARLAPALLEHLPYGVVLLGDDGGVQGWNATAEALLWPSALTRPGVRCCELFSCPPGDGCLVRAALAGAELDEHPLMLAADRGAVLVSAATESRAVALIRGARASPQRRLPVWALGATTVGETANARRDKWLSHRSGAIFKYLVVHRDRPVAADELADVFWPAAGRDAGLNSVRHFVHAMRERLAPGRARRTSAYVVTCSGGYALDLARLDLDVVRFEAAADRGLATADDGMLRDAVALYRGDFLADEPYADWAFEERERLRHLLLQALHVLAGLDRAAGDARGEAATLQRMVSLEPLDIEAQRRLIQLALARGARPDAERRYANVRSALRETLGRDLTFTLEDLSSGTEAELRRAA